MTDLTEIVRLAWVKADARYPSIDPDAAPDPKARSTYAAERVLDALAAPENRDALVAWLVDAGVIEHSGCWDSPAEPELPGQALGVDRLLTVPERTTVFYEDDDRPDAAVPLYRVQGVGERG